MLRNVCCVHPASGALLPFLSSCHGHVLWCGHPDYEVSEACERWYGGDNCFEIHSPRCVAYVVLVCRCGGFHCLPLVYEGGGGLG